MITTPALSIVDILTDLIRTGGSLDGLIWRLFVNNAAITPQTVLADLTEASFPGYAPVVGSSWMTPFQDVAGNGVVVGGNAQFRLTDAAGGQTVFGYYVTKGLSVNEKLVFVEPIAPGSGVSLGRLDMAIVVQQTYGLPGPVSADVVAG